MGGHRVAGPDRAYLAGGLVADGEDQIHFRRPRPGEFVPALAAQPARIEVGLFEEIERQGVRGALGEAAGAVRLEPSPPPMLQQRFGHDAPSRVAGAEKENIVGLRGHRRP